MFILNEKVSIANHYLAELRSIELQQDRAKFRRNLERLGFLLAYELSKARAYSPSAVQTPLGESSIPLMDNQPVLVTILRAGLPFYQGFLDAFDQADSAFIGAFRGVASPEDHSFQIEMGYCASPELQGRELILIDPMLATGKSLIKAYKTLVDQYGKPSHTHVVAAVGSQAGADYLMKEIDNVSLWMAALDPDLNDKSYIVPGLGDAGDLAYGPKMSI